MVGSWARDRASTWMRSLTLFGATFALGMLGFSAAMSSSAAAASPHKVKVSAKFVYVTGERNHQCEAEMGIEYSNQAGASSYDIRFLQTPYGVQDLPDVVPQAAEDVLLTLLKPAGPKGAHFDDLAGGGGTPNATVPHCYFAKTFPGAAHYSNLTVVAVVP